MGVLNLSQPQVILNPKLLLPRMGSLALKVKNEI